MAIRQISKWFAATLPLAVLAFFDRADGPNPIHDGGNSSRFCESAHFLQEDDSGGEHPRGNRSTSSHLFDQTQSSKKTEQTATNRSLITSESFHKIRLGMTKRNVETILGGPPRMEVLPKDPFWMPEATSLGALHCEWWGVEGIIYVYYDGDIVRKTVFGIHPVEVEPIKQ